MSSTNSYPVLPLRNTILFPENILPIAVGRPKSVAVINDAVVKAGEDGKIVFLTQKDENVNEPGVSDLYQVGTVAKILKVIKVQDDNLTVVVQGERRVRLTKMTDMDPYFVGDFEDVEDDWAKDAEEEALFQNLRTTAIEIVDETPDVPKETAQILGEITDPSKFCDFIAGNLDTEIAERQQILEAVNIKDRMRAVLEALQKQIQVAKLADQIRDNMMKETDKTQREYYLRQQLKAIKKELGEGEDDLDELEYRIDSADFPEEVEEQARKQLSRLRTMQSSSSEYSVTLNYVETLLDVPWHTISDDNLDLEGAQDTLDADHYGLDKVKKRIVEYLAVRQLKKDMKGPILCLVGPPGVGKTSLGKSVARTMGRKFVRVSLGGMHDESEIRGHRRTYVGAMPGRFVKALQKAGTANPVIMLDEIDKIGSDFRGDPQAAMLEVLDPEQNHEFSDHYLEVPLDLSKVLFIATANQLSTISAPLRDRMEIIEVPSYTSYEKKQIALNHLVPKQIEEHGITDENIDLSDEALEYLINRYTREAGVRNLERRIADVCRSVAVKVAKEDESRRQDIHVDIDEDYVSDALGPERYHSEIAQRVTIPGVATGLAWTQSGGDILFVEATKMKGEGKLKLTGQLGDVMKESVEAAISYLRSNSTEFGLTPDFMENSDIHVHFPAGAVPKDGPSAGITIFSAVLSVLHNIKVRKDVAMTGEITLRGNVLPVGGIKEKVTAAHRAGIKHIVLPKMCEKDLVDLSDEIRNDMEFHPVERVDELPELVFDDELPKVPVEDGDPAGVPAAGQTVN